MGNPMAFARAEARVVVVDRGLLVTDMVMATTIPILLQVAVWSALFAAGARLDMTYPELISYYVFVVCLSRINNGYDIVEQLSEAVHEGTLDPHLMRPMPYWLQRLSGFVGGSVVYSLIVVVALAGDMFLRPWTAGASWGDVAVFLLAAMVILLVSQILTFFVAFTLALLVAWLTRPELSLSLLILLQTVLGGTLLPPSLWGESLRWFMTYNPFAYMLAVPATFLSSRDIAGAWPAIGGALVYIGVFAVVSGLLWRLMMRRFEGVGG